MTGGPVGPRTGEMGFTRRSSGPDPEDGSGSQA
jgi:hypothetical protein